MILQGRTCYFDGDTAFSLLKELVGVFEETENAGFKIICSFEQLKQSTSPPCYIWFVK